LIARSPRSTACPADFYDFDMAFLGRVANRIVNEVRRINRVSTT
jgi:GMP synthase PP-ATPase subunit